MAVMFSMTNNGMLDVVFSKRSNRPTTVAKISEYSLCRVWDPGELATKPSLEKVVFLFRSAFTTLHQTQQS